MTGPRTGLRRGVLLIILTCVLLVAGYLAVASGRQVLADRAYHPITVPPATAPAASIAAALATDPPSSSAPVPSAPVPTAAGVAAALAGKLSAAGLGPSVSAVVSDAQTGAPLFSRRPDTEVAPASTSKLLTAAAILTVHRATDRFVTKVVAGGSPGTVVLVGGGDPTLSAAPAGQQVEYPEAARISELAAKVRASLAGAPVTRVLVDDSLFTGPITAPGWAPEDAPSSYGAPITATMVDAARDAPDDVIRSGAPDLAAGSALATALDGAQVARGAAPAGARVLGSVQSAPVNVLVEQMLRDSDNIMADVLARQVAIAEHQPASFAGGAAAIRSVDARLGVQVGTGMKDGSGLSALDRIPTRALNQVLLATTGTQYRQLRPILSGMPVAGWEGSLVEENRFTGAASVADGSVRAKTGSLTGVSSLAGVLTDADGRQLVFAFVADHTPSEAGARAAIDQLAATLVGCGCR